MKTKNNARLLKSCLGAALAGVLAMATFAYGQDKFPSHPIAIILPLPPGGSADPIMRLVAQKVSENIGQPIVIDNRPGAGGNIAANVVKVAVPNGYTLMMGNTSTHAINASLFSNPGFDPIKDFAPITELMSLPLVLVVPANSPAKTMQDLAALAKTKTDALNNGTPGAGSGSHLMGELLKSKFGAPIVHVHYRGAAPAMTDLLAGRIDMVFATTVSAGAYLQDGKLRALGVTSTKRSPALPMVPTMAEAGFPGIEYELWYGMLAPAGTPAPVITLLNEQFVAAARSADVMKMAADQGAEITAGTPNQFASRIASDIARLGTIVREGNIKVD